MAPSSLLPSSFSHRSDLRSDQILNLRQKWAFCALFVLTWSVNEWVRTREEEDVPLTPSNPVVVESIKLAVSACYYFWQRRSRSQSKTDTGRAWKDREDVVPLNGLGDGSSGRGSEGIASNGDYRHRPESRWDVRIPPSIAVALTLLASIFFTYHGHLALLIERVFGSITLYLTSSAATLLLVLAAYVLSSMTVTLLSWQAVLMQFAGFWIIHSSITSLHLSASLYPIVIGLAFSLTLAFTLMEFLYQRVHSISVGGLHVILFTGTCLINFLSYARPTSALASGTTTLSWPIFFRSTVQASLDILIFVSIFLQGALSTGILLSCSAAIYLWAYCVQNHAYTIGILLGSCITIAGSARIFISSRHEDQSFKPPGWVTRIIAALSVCAVTIYLALATHRAVLDTLSSVPAKATSLLDRIIDSKATCHRKPLPSDDFWPHKRAYHAFDNVLLVVFFSHARYDVNLDYYHEVYSEFFPNIVFVGPGSREDQGFRHSYDVLVDTYEADEDLNDPTFFKMAGRMAHHMLYTAMREYDCYDGYLWAPFDTLLNIPRLQQFDQNLFWYHSPFGEYVYNPALGDEAANRNKTRHAPPANISPDPALNLTATWRHWGPDWWWGEPHVGVAVCMRAFQKVAPHMRAHLASLSNGTRLIGGSADTLYIPGRHRETFLEVLGLFLETDCFLEIATPTAVHLVSPPGDPILFVDHYWIWQPPFNASFVRQQWAQGLEVDTFHTFHWGDKGEDGVWKAEPGNIEDVRRLQKQSAIRQNLDWPYWSSELD